MLCPHTPAADLKVYLALGSWQSASGRDPSSKNNKSMEKSIPSAVPTLKSKYTNPNTK